MSFPKLDCNKTITSLLFGVSFSPLTLPKTDHLGENQPLSHRQSCRKAQKGKELRSADQPSVSLKVALPSPLTPSAAAPSPVH